ncbi:MAG: hypothetical protein EA380_11885 [Phycisphaeraceae bacterium]|nr:MAG: hypothetical protein EA380_11885 [Phycisphaeraceae bacterium]
MDVRTDSLLDYAFLGFSSLTAYSEEPEAVFVRSRMRPVMSIFGESLIFLPASGREVAREAIARTLNSPSINAVYLRGPLSYLDNGDGIQVMLDILRTGVLDRRPDCRYWVYLQYLSAAGVSPPDDDREALREMDSAGFLEFIESAPHGDFDSGFSTVAMLDWLLLSAELNGWSTLENKIPLAESPDEFYAFRDVVVVWVSSGWNLEDRDFVPRAVRWLLHAPLENENDIRVAALIADFLRFRLGTLQCSPPEDEDHDAVSLECLREGIRAWWMQPGTPHAAPEDWIAYWLKRSGIELPEGDVALSESVLEALSQVVATGSRANAFAACRWFQIKYPSVGAAHRVIVLRPFSPGEAADLRAQDDGPRSVYSILVALDGWLRLRTLATLENIKMDLRITGSVRE